MPPEVFISYAPEEKGVAEAVCASLKSVKIHCRMAHKDILPSVEYDEGIIDGIDGSRLFLLILSAKSNA